MICTGALVVRLSSFGQYPPHAGKLILCQDLEGLEGEFAKLALLVGGQLRNDPADLEREIAANLIVIVASEHDVRLSRRRLIARDLAPHLR